MTGSALVAPAVPIRALTHVESVENGTRTYCVASAI
jgi:hypothetical protein